MNFLFNRGLGVLLLAISQLTWAGGGPVGPRLPPTDESEQAPELARFLEELRTAVDERDVQFLQAALADDVLIGFGPNESGAEAAASALEDTESPLWQQLESSLSFGGSFVAKGERPRFCLPYIYSAFPDSIDPLEHQVIVKSSIEARTEAGRTAEKIPLPDYAIVRTDIGSAQTTKDKDGRTWARIYVDDRPAYVPADALRSPLDSRTCLEKRGQHWEVSAIISGD